MALVGFLALTLAFSSGCSLLGLAVGSQLPHYQTVAHPTRGDALHVEMDDGELVAGAAVEVGPTTVTLLSSTKTRELETKHMKKLERRRGNEALSTFVIGLVVDAVIATIATIGVTVSRH